MIHLRVLITAFFLLQQRLWVLAAPAADASQQKPSPSSSSSAPSQTEFASDDPNFSLTDQFQNQNPEPIRGNTGAKILGPQNVPLDRQNADLLAPPSTDAGSVSNAKWPFSLSHNRVQQGGWAREQNVETMPIATGIAGVNMRLEAGAIRELHWHITAEWAYMIAGQVVITAMTPEGQNYEASVGPGDVWYFPPGIPHSIQATSQNPDGAEFLLVFDSGDFSEDDTFLLTDWMAHVPKEVLAKNFQIDISALNKIPKNQLYIFPGTPPTPPKDNKPEVTSPNGEAPMPFTFEWSKTKPTTLSGGSVKMLDSMTFQVSKTIAASEVWINPGGMRELHWHPMNDEWSYLISGQARVTIFAADGNARTFDYEAGDVGYVPSGFGHYVENIGNDTVHFLEILKSDRVTDVSLNQWLALTSPELVKAHLNVDDETISKLSKTKQIVVG